MDMSCSRQHVDRRRALTAAGGLVTGAFLALAGPSHNAASAPARRPALAAAGQYANPVIWQDFADIDVIRVGDTYYASASTMHYSPGAPVLRSYDLVNWEIAGHSVPVPSPAVPTPPRQVTPMTGVDTFDGTTLKPRWEWNHNPDNTKWSAGNGLTLRTATVTNDLYWARNTLTHRVQGPTSTATVQIDHTAMRDGNRAGLALLRDSSAWIGVRREGGTTRVAMVSGLTMDGSWTTTGTGTELASAALSSGRIWLRATADIRPGAARPGTFSYSTDGTNFTRLGPALTMGNDWRFFMGYRFALFDHATQTLGGAVRVLRFELSTP